MKDKQHGQVPVWLQAVRLVYPAVVCAVCLFLCEWIARGTLKGFWSQYFSVHEESYVLAWLFLLLIYMLVDGLVRFAPLSVLAAGLIAFVPAAVNYNTLALRGEPFLPWDLAQVGEATGVMGAAGIIIQKSMIVSAILILAMCVLAFFIYRHRERIDWKMRLCTIAVPVVLLAGEVFGIYLRPAATQYFGITPDAWMQDRYYRNYGVISAFMSNLQNLEIDKPDGYSKQAVDALVAETQQNDTGTPVYPGSYAGSAAAPEQKPTIIYVMDESYWDVSELEQYGIRFDTDVSKNLHRLQQTSGYGRSYSPSFGGGTCDVEFEALTGYSKEYLPSGSKPYQQHVTHSMFSLPNYLKGQGYQTAAVHCFYGKYWSRNTAYPNLGFDDFVSLEDMTDLHQLVRSYYWKTGLVSDEDMGRQIIKKYESMSASSDAPVFLHAVTMQNHTNYNAANYPDNERVHVTAAPEGIDDETLGALEDFATGVRDADQMLGTLTDYFSQVDEPVILVFWGDHYNPINSNYKVFTETGYASDDSNDPALHETTLLYWSNYSDQKVDVGSIAAYEITPVMMDLYGIEKPVFYEYLTQQLASYRSRSCGVTVQPDGSTSDTLTPEQESWYSNHWLLQYDLMFGKEYALEDAG
jgi:phosphoglycerol transferase MdoB-like AlkP superfamily enzyme